MSHETVAVAGRVPIKDAERLAEHAARAGVTRSSAVAELIRVALAVAELLERREGAGPAERRRLLLEAIAILNASGEGSDADR